MEKDKFRIIDGKIVQEPIQATFGKSLDEVIVETMGKDKPKVIAVSHGSPVVLRKVKSTDTYYTETYSKGCTHYRQAVAVGKFQIFVTSYRTMITRGQSDEVMVPDYGIYFANEWLGLMGDMWSNKRELPTNGTIKYPCTVVNWKDFGTVKPEMMEKLIQIVRTRLQMGQKVDVGCYGSHGRTGTFLSCLLGKMEKLDGYTAIKEVRKRYCQYAVESDSQVQFIWKFLSKTPFNQNEKNKEVLPNVSSIA